MTALAEAMKAAGVLPVQERLAKIAAEVMQMTQEEWVSYAGCGQTLEQDRIQRRMMQVAREAIKASPRNWDGAKDAFYAKVRRDPDLLWELLGPHRAAAAQFWLSQAASAIRDEERPRIVADTRSDAGHTSYGDHARAARVAPEAGGQSDPDNQPGLAPRNQIRTGHKSNESHRQSARPDTAAALAVVTRLSLLDTFKANGRPIGELTPLEANKWAGSRERDARFVRMLTANLPPDQPIKKYRTPEDAAAMYARAETDHAE